MNDPRYLKSHDAIFLETSWERQMQYSGMERWDRNQYKKNGEKVDTSTSDVGQKLITRFHPIVDKAIDTAQRDIMKSTNGKRSIKSSVRGTCIVVPAETCSLLTLKLLFDRVGEAPEGVGSNYQNMCSRLGKLVQTELNYRNWIKESRADAREFAKENGLTNIPISQADRLIAQAGLTPRSIQRWKKVFKELNEYEWSYREISYVGDFLLATTVEALEGSFEFHNATIKGLPKRHIRMTESFKKEFDNLGASMCRFQAIKKPMLVTPQAWTHDAE